MKQGLVSVFHRPQNKRSSRLDVYGVFFVVIDAPTKQAGPLVPAGNTKGGSITVPLTSCLTGLD
jgi:hypothetical protein